MWKKKSEPPKFELSSYVQIFDVLDFFVTKRKTKDIHFTLGRRYFLQNSYFLDFVKFTIFISFCLLTGRAPGIDFSQFVVFSCLAKHNNCHTFRNPLLVSRHQVSFCNNFQENMCFHL